MNPAFVNSPSIGGGEGTGLAVAVAEFPASSRGLGSGLDKL